MLDGDRMAKSLYYIKFATNVDLTTLCTVKLSEKELENLELAIEDLYYFEFVVGKYLQLCQQIFTGRSLIQ